MNSANIKDVIFIGNRFGVLEVCLADPDWRVREIFAVTGSHLERELKARGLAHRVFTFKDKVAIVDAIDRSSFDILVSNGCPFILPISRFVKPGRLFLNTHPALLPDLKGPHPVNGCLLEGRSAFGATTHYMVDGVDEGNILSQESVELTPDLDAGLVYRLSFWLEAKAFRNAVARLKSSAYQAPGEAQATSESFYKRSPADQKADATRDSCREIERKARAFGIRSLGIELGTIEGSFRVFEACAVTNRGVRERFATGKPGAIALRYDEKILVETHDGFVRLVAFEKTR